MGATPMDQWIIQKNIERFEQIVRMLGDDPTKRQTVETLLSRERRMLAAMESEAEAQAADPRAEMGSD
jgi:hypothetical protein